MRRIVADFGKVWQAFKEFCVRVWRWIVKPLLQLAILPVAIIYVRGLVWLVDYLSPSPHYRLTMMAHYIGSFLRLVLQPAPVWAVATLIALALFRRPIGAFLDDVIEVGVNKDTRVRLARGTKGQPPDVLPTSKNTETGTP